MRRPRDYRAHVYRSRDGWWVEPPAPVGVTVTCLGPFPAWPPAYRMAVALAVSAESADVVKAHREALRSQPWPGSGNPHSCARCGHLPADHEVDGRGGGLGPCWGRSARERHWWSRRRCECPSYRPGGSW